MNKPLGTNTSSDRFFTELINSVSNYAGILEGEESARYRALAGLITILASKIIKLNQTKFFK